MRGVGEANALPQGEESIVSGDAGYHGVDQRGDAKADVPQHVAMRAGKHRVLNKDDEADAIFLQIEKLKAGVQAKVEHPFQVIKRQFGFAKVRYRGLKKIMAKLFTLFAMSNICMAHSNLMGVRA
jgi:IS5 family transposase